MVESNLNVHSFARESTVDLHAVGSDVKLLRQLRVIANLFVCLFTTEKNINDVLESNNMIYLF